MSNSADEAEGVPSAESNEAAGAAGASRAGGLVVSLDFELAWGVRDTLGTEGAYRKNLLGAREAVPRLLDLFDRFGVAATWATVGFLFAESRDELLAHAPRRRPGYADRRFDPYAERLGEGERDDPLHFAPSLVAEIAGRPGQELASHTFSHYYCLEEGQTFEEFDADLASAASIAAARGHRLTSLVFPRNQLRHDYLDALVRNGFTAFRGSERNALNRPRPGASGSGLVRALRLSDVYVNLTGHGGIGWDEMVPVGGLVDVRGSRFLRPWNANPSLEAMRWGRVAASMKAAAVSGRVFHLWWHPHNFGAHLQENLAALARHLELFAQLRDSQGFASYTMAEVAARAARAVPGAA